MRDLAAVRSFRALILEDHDFQRRIGAQVLMQCGATQVLEASDGAGALELIAASDGPIDVLLCDLNMPGMDGLAFLRHIAECGCNSSVILASSLDASIIRAAEIMARSYGIRLVGAVEKPLARSKLLPLVLRHFSMLKAKPRMPVALMPIEEILTGIDRGEFLPFFQPKVQMRTDALVGVEVLMRWRHPTRGLVPPAAFIPVMEAHGVISTATFAVLGAAMEQYRRWRQLGLDVPIALNISVESLSDTSLPDRLAAIAMQVGCSPSSVTLEITETVAMTDLGHALETLARCRMKGFELSIDDYGTGFSSMQLLSRLPVSELKIDQSFVTGAAKEPVHRALIETTVMMAQRLNLRSVAEGIENDEDWDVIAGLGCDIGQGYFIARPMPGDELSGWYENWRGNREGKASCPGLAQDAASDTRGAGV
jgi:EAL domain-containing protein (putative c-di-GMP-specific phosphodiesterase class I)/AmiR/NasT family two-component response regulator